MCFLQFCGIWEKGKFIKGEWILRDGNIYEGIFLKNKFNGLGKFKFVRNRNVLEGEYKKNVWILLNLIIDKIILGQFVLLFLFNRVMYSNMRFFKRGNMI